MRQGTVSTTTDRPRGAPGYCAGHHSCSPPLQCYGAFANLSLPVTTLTISQLSSLPITSVALLPLLPLGICLLQSLYPSTVIHPDILLSS